MTEPKKEEIKSKPAQKPPAPKIILPTASKRHTKSLVIFGVVFVVILGIGGFFLIQWTNKPAQAPVVLTPPPTALPSASATETPPASGTQTTGAAVSPFDGTFQSGADTDSDGLTDKEEVEIYRSDSRLPDTDSDGFLDGNEVFNGYDPTAAPPQTLLQGGLAKEFFGTTPFSFVVWHPASWSLVVERAVSEDQTFVSTTGEQFRLSVKQKDAAQSLSDWYAAQEISGTPRVSVTKKGKTFLMSENQLFAFVDVGQGVATFAYEPGTKGTLEYLMTLQMMVNSLAVEQ